MTPLGELIEQAQRLFADAHGIDLTYGDIARRSQGRLSRQRVQQLAKGPVKALPTPEIIYGLALGLTVPESVVLERALASAGYTGPRQQRRDEARDAAAIETPDEIRARFTAERKARLRSSFRDHSQNGDGQPPGER